MEPTGLSVWPDIRPHFLHLPGQRGRQSGASGVFWSLGLTESSLQDKTRDLIWFILILPHYFQIQSTFGYSTDSSTLQLNHFIAAGCCQSVWEHQLKLVWRFESVTPAACSEIWAAHLQEQIIIYPSTSTEQYSISSPQTWTWTLQRCRRRPLFWLTCCPLRNRRPPWRTPPSFGSAGTPETGLQGGCSPKSSVGAKVTHQRGTTSIFRHQSELYYSAGENYCINSSGLGRSFLKSEGKKLLQRADSQQERKKSVFPQLFLQ